LSVINGKSEGCPIAPPSQNGHLLWADQVIVSDENAERCAVSLLIDRNDLIFVSRTLYRPNGRSKCPNGSLFIYATEK
jgi:hypothetical protein